MQVIREVLPLLGEDDRKALAEQLGVTAGGATPRKRIIDLKPPESEGDAFARELYEALSAQVLRKVQVKLAPWSIFMTRRKRTKLYMDAAASAKSMHDTWFPKLNRAERKSMLGLYAELCYDHAVTGRMAESSMPLSVKLALSVTDLPQVLDRAFPGYAASGLLPRVAAARFAGGAAARRV